MYDCLCYANLKCWRHESVLLSCWNLRTMWQSLNPWRNSYKLLLAAPLRGQRIATTEDSVAGIALAMPISEIAQNIDNHSRSQLYLAYAELDGIYSIIYLYNLIHTYTRYTCTYTYTYCIIHYNTVYVFLCVCVCVPMFFVSLFSSTQHLWFKQKPMSAVPLPLVSAFSGGLAVRRASDRGGWRWVGNGCAGLSLIVRSSRGVLPWTLMSWGSSPEIERSLKDLRE